MSQQMAPLASSMEYMSMDPENAPSIILPIAILIAILAACGILSMVLVLLTGVITLAA